MIAKRNIYTLPLNFRRDSTFEFHPIHQSSVTPPIAEINLFVSPTNLPDFLREQFVKLLLSRSLPLCSLWPHEKKLRSNGKQQFEGALRQLIKASTAWVVPRIVSRRAISDSKGRWRPDRRTISTDIDRALQGAIQLPAFRWRRYHISLAVCIWTEGSAGHCN